MDEMQQHRQRDATARGTAQSTAQSTAESRREQEDPGFRNGQGAESSLEPKHPLVPAKRVNGSAVFNQAGERIGEVEDIAIDKRTGKVAYAILSFGGFMGMGEKHQPLPWSALD